VPKDELLDPGYVDRVGFFRHEPLCREVLEVARGSFREKEPPEIRGGRGYVVDTLEAALWAFHRSEDFASGALMAVNLGGDADTTGAVYGQLAGGYYGLPLIKAEWRELVTHGAAIMESARALAGEPSQ
jgi:ADP-ribosylglycohydrolase